MARKSKQNTTKTPVASTTTSASIPASASPVPTQGRSLFSFNTQKAINLLALAAVYAPLSQLILAPVYGSIPSAKYHKYIITGAPLLSYVLQPVLPGWSERLLPVMAFWIPTIHLILFGYSSRLAEWGPLVTEMLTTFPLITLTNYVAMKLVQDVELPAVGGSEAGPPMIIYALFTIFQRTIKSVLPSLMGTYSLLNRLPLQLSIGVLYGLILPQSLFWPALPSVVFTMVANPHLPMQRTTQIAANTLALHNYTLIERKESLTGYLSVLEDTKNKFRVLRCDHSLLGGEWQLPPQPGQLVSEPIYAVFTMLEAVRLIESTDSLSPAVKDSDKTALTIGLGIGTAPTALITHGINTTILELDPVVHEFATKYFNLPSNHMKYIGDAIDFIHSRANHVNSLTPNPPSNSAPLHPEISSLQYDHIIHDTFTGGALPIGLFTHSFLINLSRLLKPSGSIAINFAGDLDLPTARLVYRTIKSVFPVCRIYREDLPSSSKSKQSNSQNSDGELHDQGNPKAYEGDFTNLVYFCLSPLSTQKQIKFRKPTKGDFLGSRAREHFMLPKYEVIGTEKFGCVGDDKAECEEQEKQQPLVLDEKDAKSIKLVEEDQEKSALGHWRLMRSVIPDVVWETW